MTGSDAITFGLGLFTGQAPTEGGRPTHHQLPELAVAAEEAGFDAFWAAEHHAFADGYLPALLLGLASAAGVTKRIRLGAGLIVAPLHHPIRLAEDAAVLQLISGGRLILGLGLGYAEVEYRMFAAPRQGRGRYLEDLVGFLRSVWAGEPAVPPGGEEPVVVTPTVPDEQPIPIWLGGYADTAVQRASRIGDGHLIGRGDLRILDKASALLRSEGGPQRPGFTVGVNLTTVLDGAGLDATAALASITTNQATYDAITSLVDPHAGQIEWSGTERRSRPPALHAVGDAETVVAALEEHCRPLLPFGRVHVVLRAIFPDADTARQQRRIAALGAEVLPALRERLKGAPTSV
jgi:alkanesulfonate monooxygenase SsuD/methylene tetrahydromethanopterin reductase-like flavin-dependent oxidoreductase (luciferase family)